MTPTNPLRVVISTRNQHKLDEIRAILRNLPVNLMSLDGFPDAPMVDEDADTLEGNASKKANVLFAHTLLPTVADDTGLEVEALGGAPGVHSARYAGPACDDADNRRKLLDEMKGMDTRRAQFRTVIAFTTTAGTVTFEGVCKGRIGQAERGNLGFGYDSLFVPDGYEQTFAELPPEVKNSISHRGRALHYFATFLEKQIQNQP